ncbi:MAG: SDR family oxidoreductase [Alphaproteobacteria bacterium]|jgi:nucleoside-diphosphate-sugar epimerase|nr:SDR family oxidoreductase [Alphaproteobacteria bacterium]MBT7943077.1 SDR family oxidoreductase [Alphaproteobacteria bacterium]
MRVLVTGAAGFVGRALVPALSAAGHEVAAVVRQTPEPPFDDGVSVHTVADIGPDTDWTEALGGIDAVIHLAGRAHIMNDRAADAEDKYNHINAVGTEHLARAAVDEGVKRFILMSTVKVMGEETPNAPFSESDTPAPEDAYGASKLAGEQALRRVAGESDLEAVILRPPLLYGPGAKGNFLSLLKLCRLAPPLPLAGIDNRRSLLFVGNLVDAVLICLESPNAAGETFFIRDGEDLSTPELVRRVGNALKKPQKLFPMPSALLRLVGRLTGKSQTVDRLTGSLQVNDDKIRQQLGWTPPFNVVQGLDKMATWFISGKTH